MVSLFELFFAYEVLSPDSSAAVLQYNSAVQNDPRVVWRQLFELIIC